jgi:anti-sigma factor RsiW
MNCVEWETRVALHAGGDLAGGDAAEVERHLGECSACQSLWSDVRESLAVLQAAHAEVPAAAHFTAVRSRVMAELERSAQPWRRLAWISGVGVAAALLLMFALWPSPRAVPQAPRMLASIPPAPVVVKAAPAIRRPVRQVAARVRPRTPLTVKLQTTDPNIVIYWIAD